MIKTNKSYTKRLKVTKTGKILARSPGQNHFSAKERARAGMSKHRMKAFQIKNKARSYLLANS